MCTDQDAVNLIRETHDPQIASKQLVDHALSKFSTDNLSCMVVRFDNRAVVQTVERQKEPIGVEGDQKGGMSEADAIVKEARKSMGDIGRGSLALDGANDETKAVTQDMIREEAEQEPGPELDPQGAQALKPKAPSWIK